MQLKLYQTEKSQATVKKNSNGSSKSTLPQQIQNQIYVSAQNTIESVL